MTQITVQIDESQAAVLKEKAARFGLQPEQFITASIVDLLSQPDPNFEQAVQRVLQKNKDLYRRLA